MIYRVNGVEPLDIHYFDDSINPNAKADAEAMLIQKRAEALTKHAVRFSICSTFVDGNNSTWRTVEDSDPEDTICQVFNYSTGRYTECQNKTQAIAMNEQIKETFLAEIMLDKVYEVDSIPTEVDNIPTNEGTV